MTAAEILRNFANIIANATSNKQPDGQLVQISIPDMQLGSPQELDPDPKMIPPLQQNLELLKKSVGVESEYDEECECGCNDEGSCNANEPEDELDALLRVAGIKVISSNDVQ